MDKQFERVRSRDSSCSSRYRNSQFSQESSQHRMRHPSRDSTDDSRWARKESNLLHAALTNRRSNLTRSMSSQEVTRSPRSHDFRSAPPTRSASVSRKPEDRGRRSERFNKNIEMDVGLPQVKLPGTPITHGWFTSEFKSHESNESHKESSDKPHQQFQKWGAYNFDLAEEQPKKSSISPLTVLQDQYNTRRPGNERDMTEYDRKPKDFRSHEKKRYKTPAPRNSDPIQPMYSDDDKDDDTPNFDEQQLEDLVGVIDDFRNAFVQKSPQTASNRTQQKVLDYKNFQDEPIRKFVGSDASHDIKITHDTISAQYTSLRLRFATSGVLGNVRRNTTQASDKFSFKDMSETIDSMWSANMKMFESNVY